MATPALVPGGTTGTGVQVGIDAVGDAAAAWTDGSGPAAVPMLARQDAAPPTITPIQVINGPPAIGTPLGFVVTTSDRVSPVSVAWTFGDGATAAGGRVATRSPGTAASPSRPRDGRQPATPPRPPRSSTSAARAAAAGASPRPGRGSRPR